MFFCFCFSLAYVVREEGAVAVGRALDLQGREERGRGGGAANRLAHPQRGPPEVAAAVAARDAHVAGEVDSGGLDADDGGEGEDGRGEGAAHGLEHALFPAQAPQHRLPVALPRGMTNGQTDRQTDSRYYWGLD